MLAQNLSCFFFVPLYFLCCYLFYLVFILVYCVLQLLLMLLKSTVLNLIGVLTFCFVFLFVISATVG